jgi:glutathione S-transferase
MSETIEIFGFGTHDRSSKVRWVAYELGLDVKENRVEPGKHFSEEYRALNPLSIIPAVVFRDEIYVESTAICHFLAETFPESGLTIAPGSPFRYDFLKWTSMFTETFEIRMVDFVLSQRGILPEEYGAVHEKIIKKRAATVAELLPSEGFLVGDRFTVADVFAAYSMKNAFVSGMLEWDQVKGYLRPLADRPAAKAAEFFGDLPD